MIGQAQTRVVMPDNAEKPKRAQEETLLAKDWCVVSIDDFEIGRLRAGDRGPEG